ncbi:MAG: imelysin family protein [Bacteroidota bacterium]
MKKLFYLLPLVALVFVIHSCSKDDDPEEVLAALKTTVIANYANLVLNNYQAAQADAISLRTAINAFTSNPTQSTFDAAKQAWLDSRESYGITEAFRFANGPIDVIGTEEGPEGLLNAWPLDENFIDYVDGGANDGIVNDLVGFPTLSKDVLTGENGNGGEENVSVGYHAIEFLLWGQDLTDPSAEQAGMRPFTDFVNGGTAENQDRRRQYLEICADLIVDHLQLLIDEWEATGPYRATFLAQDANVNLANMMTGIATLAKGELAGERTFVAYTNRDQEDEHSCFSDNTHRDLRLNFQGIKNVFLSSIGGVTSSSIADLIDSVDESLGAEVRAALEAAETAVEATAIPFDNAISDDALRPDVLAAVTALQTLGDLIADGGTALGIQVDTE